ncbi:hypothetical protein lerEdw1_012372 [Lerista edwardsae]|nr:hypothetical protein lerEdw1_012372 [Lerista edwardsae]
MEKSILVLELVQNYILRWYHGNLTRHAAEALLLSNGSDGSYLLRQSNTKALYTLSVRAKDSVKHFHVGYTGSSYKFGFNEFSSLKDFIMHFANQPLIGSETEKNTLRFSDFLFFWYHFRIGKRGGLHCTGMNSNIIKTKRLVFPLRTYYLYAKTGVEADEWIKILQWKLVRIWLSCKIWLG